MRAEDTTIKRLEFEYTVRPMGNSAHILVPKSLIGKRVKVIVDVLEEDSKKR